MAKADDGNSIRGVLTLHLEATLVQVHLPNEPISLIFIIMCKLYRNRPYLVNGPWERMIVEFVV
jgi:hypothetical protein